MLILILISLFIAAFVAETVYALSFILRGSLTGLTLEFITSPYEQHPDDPSMRILVGGDSTGVGTGARDPRDSIAGRLGREYPGADITNISQNGIVIAQLLKRMETMLPPNAHYDIIVYQIGANDVIKFSGNPLIRQGIKTLLDRADALADRTYVMTAGNVGLAPVLRPPLTTLYGMRMRKTRKIFIDEIARHPRAQYVDLWREAVDEKLNTDIPRYYAPDQFHPSGEGYGVWYEKLRAVMAAHEPGAAAGIIPGNKQAPVR